MPKISSGSDTVDRFIGGYPDSVLTMIYGEPASGKTTLGMHAALIAAKYGRKVIYIDTEEGFSLDRLRQLDPECDSYLSNLFVLPCRSFLEQEKIILSLPTNVSLVVVDTIGHLYRMALREDADAANQSMIAQLQHLSRLNQQSIPVLLINQVYADFATGGVKNVGGNLLRTFCRYIILLSTNPREFALEEPDGKKCPMEIVQEGITLLL